jgi:arylsulfatase A-like enzyme
MSHSVRALDDAVGNILDGLGDRSRDTLVVYLSDNGFLFGEHRRFGKTDAYEESVRVPMVVRYPAMLTPEGKHTSQALVSNVDITPTIASLAGIPWSADGRSLIPLLDGSAASVGPRSDRDARAPLGPGLAWMVLRAADAGGSVRGRGHPSVQARAVRERSASCST